MVKDLPTGFPAESMYTGLTGYLSSAQCGRARVLERNHHVGDLDIWSDSSGCFVRSRVDTQDPNRRAVKDYAVLLFFEAHKPVKITAVQAELMQSTEWRECMEGTVGAKEKLLELLDDRFRVVPKPRDQWSKKLRPGCECPHWKYKKNSYAEGSPVHCVHTCALMLKLAYTVEQNPWLLAEIMGFYAPSMAVPVAAPAAAFKSTRLNLMLTSDEDDSEDELIKIPTKKVRIEPGTSRASPIVL